MVSCFYEFSAILLALAVCVITYFKWRYTYWRRKGVPYIEPRIPFGNGQNPFRADAPSYETLRRQYDYFKAQGHPHGGLYMASTYAYLPIDPELIKNILAKDFNHFTDRGVFFSEKGDPLSAHLFSLEGQRWRNLRTKLTPTFTSGKMKTMFGTLLECGEQMLEHVDNLCAEGEAMDVKDVMASYTTDVIGSCAFGLQCNSFKDPNSEFRSFGRNLFKPSLDRKFRFSAIILFPSLCKKIGLRIFQKKLTDFYMGVVKDVLKHRQENGVHRNDFMQILMELKEAPDGLTFEQVAAQAFVFFLAGFETSSSVLNYCLFELAQHPDIQEKTRREILEVLDKFDGKLTYDAIAEMKYMAQVVDETLRKYPTAPTLLRKCVKDYKIPGMDVVVEKGTRVIVSVLGLHMDREYYSDPEKFDPDRFNEENKLKIRPFTYMPFGEGPRNCIGLRFGLMQVRVGLALILRQFKVKPNPNTVLPLKMLPNSFLLISENKILLDVERI